MKFAFRIVDVIKLLYTPATIDSNNNLAKIIDLRNDTCNKKIKIDLHIKDLTEE